MSAFHYKAWSSDLLTDWRKHKASSKNVFSENNELTEFLMWMPQDAYTQYCQMNKQDIIKNANFEARNSVSLEVFKEPELHEKYRKGFLSDTEYLKQRE